MLSNISFKKAIWLSPIVYLFHIIEEAVFGFYKFMNKHLGGGENDLISFLLANMIIMAVYIILNIIFTLQPYRFNAFFVLTLLAAAQFFNAFYHLLWTIVFREYCPGVVTGFVIYVPFVSILLWIAYREEYITKTSVALILLLGAILMSLFEIEDFQILVLIISPTVVILTNIIYYFKTQSKK
ncbi:MAG: HXXEE domain-containing protein [Promethearchaeota archaeon]